MKVTDVVLHMLGFEMTYQMGSWPASELISAWTRRTTPKRNHKVKAEEGLG